MEMPENDFFFFFISSVGKNLNQNLYDARKTQKKTLDFYGSFLSKLVDLAVCSYHVTYAF